MDEYEILGISSLLIYLLCLCGILLTIIARDLGYSGNHNRGIEKPKYWNKTNFPGQCLLNESTRFEMQFYRVITVETNGNDDKEKRKIEDVPTEEEIITQMIEFV